jgi:hypothetical protein
MKFSKYSSTISSEKEMTDEEFCNWIALCNALKFINNTSQLTGKCIKEKDIDYREMINYINTVSGDIHTCFKEKSGIPFKYNLDSYIKESLETEDLSYEFLS